MKLAVVILNWNVAADTIGCVSKITAWQTIDPTVWVVDNSSGDDSVARIKAACPQARLICNGQNQGFAGGTNRGIETALATETDAPILLLNNDAAISEADILRLLQTLQESPQIGLLGPLLFDAEQPERLISAGGKNPVLHHNTRLQQPPGGKPVYPVENVSGTVIVINPAVFKTVGLLDEDYFFSTELADLCLRARQQGYLSGIDSRARAFHSVRRSASLRDTLYVYYIIRNRFLFLRNAPYKLKIFLYFFWTLYSAALGAKLTLARQPATARAVWLGLTDGLRGRFGGQNHRVLAACARPQPVQAPQI